MKKISKKQRAIAAEIKPEKIVGLDLGDRYSHYCMLTCSGDLMEEGRIRSTVAALEKQFGNEPRMRIALETGTHSPWVSRLLESHGHQVIVANARKIPTITASESKNDRNDAEQLARMAAFDPKLLHPIEHRSLERQQDLNLVHTRSVLVRARTMLINSVRGLVKSSGGRWPACSSAAFPGKARTAMPEELKTACEPLLEQIVEMNRGVGEMDRKIDGLDKKYPEISVLRTAPGVGPVVAACYVLTLDRAEAMETNRQAGAYLGLRPRQQQSGDSNPQRGIAKTGNSYLRSLLVIYSGPLWPRLGAASLGTQAGRQRRETRQETGPRRRGPQTGGGAAEYVAQPQEV